MSNIDDDLSGFPVDVQQRIMHERQRQRQRTGINAAAELGVFSSEEPAELSLVRARDAELEEQHRRATRPQDFTAIPTYETDTTEAAIAVPNVAMPIRTASGERYIGHVVGPTVTRELEPPASVDDVRSPGLHALEACEIEALRGRENLYACYTHKQVFESDAAAYVCPAAPPFEVKEIAAQPSVGDVIAAAFPDEEDPTVS